MEAINQALRNEAIKIILEYDLGSTKVMGGREFKTETVIFHSYEIDEYYTERHEYSELWTDIFSDPGRDYLFSTDQECFNFIRQHIVTDPILHQLISMLSDKTIADPILKHLMTLEPVISYLKDDEDEITEIAPCEIMNAYFSHFSQTIIDEPNIYSIIQAARIK